MDGCSYGGYVNWVGSKVAIINTRRAESIAPAIEAHKDPLLLANGINTLALSARLPTMFGYREGVETGGMMSYGANIPNLWRRAADFVDKILRGTKPGD